MVKKNFSLIRTFNNLIRPKKDGSNWFYPISSSSINFGSFDYLKQFQEIPELNAIINIRARAISSWDLKIVSKATGKEVGNNETLVKILRNPNWFQAQSEFWRQSSLYRDIYGNEFIYFLTPTGMPNSYKGMFALDPSSIKIKYTGDKAYFTETDKNIEYVYVFPGGETLNLELSNTIHLNDNRVDPLNFLNGTSKMQSLAGPLENIRKAYEKRNIVLRMPVGIMSNNQDDAIGQAIPMDADEKKDVKHKIMTRGAFPIITDLNVKYNAMAINAQNMGLFEEVREDTTKICDAYGVPYEMLGSQKGVTFSNLKEAKKQFYEETVIPDAQEKVDALNQQLGTEGKSWELQADFKHLPIFSEDVKDRAESLDKLVTALSKAYADQAITLEQYQSELKKLGL